MARGPLDLWNEWATQILVLLSFSLQLVLLQLAGSRRREAAPVMRLLLWLAYQLADSTAIYTIGHLSLGGTPREHKLVPFWAPFLLLHLGGPDNITAYSLEDSKLWLRHLITVVVQVLGAAYVLYKHFSGSGSGSPLLVPAISMFVVGVVKYGERTWALRCGDMNTIRSSLKKELHTKCYYHIDDKPERRSFNEGHFKREADEEEFLVRCAHSLFHVCKYAIVDSSDDSGGDTHFRDKEIFNGLTDEQTYALMGIELSLMYDMLYTKTSVISGWIIGYCIRVISSLATAGSLVIFQFNGKDGQNRVDVAITYVLLIGAFLMEVTSLLRALGSSWTFSFLCATWWKWLNHVAMCSGRWHRFRRNVVSLRHFLKAMGISRYCLSSRRWSGSMGQYNMLHFCTRRGTSFTSRLIGRLAIMLGLEDWWETVHYSGTVEILQKVKEMVFQHIRNIVGKRDVNTLGIIRKTWGQETSELWKLNDEQRTHLMGSEFQEGIIIWHIATELFLAKPKITDDQNEQPTVQAIKALSNYMMFLLVDRPDMLPGLAQNRLYQRSLKFLSEEIWPQVISDPTYRHPSRNVYTMLKELFRLHDNPNSDSWRPQGEKLASKLWEVHKNYVDDKLNAILKPEGSRVIYAVNVAEELERKNEGSDPLKLLLETWTNFLVYAANRCSRESHARKLNSGGELTTVVWLLTQHLHQFKKVRSN